MVKSAVLPANQILEYHMTGKFKAPDASWTHQLFYLGDYELFVVTEGTLYLSYAGEQFTIHTGEYLLLSPCDSWRQGFRESYCSFYWLHFAPLFDATEASFELAPTGPVPKLDRIIILMKQIQDAVKNNYPRITLNAMCTGIILELYGQLAGNLPSAGTPVQKQIYSDLTDFIDLNIAANLKISDIAAHFGYNEKYLSHLFVTLTGTSLKQYILGRKIDAANLQLTDTNNSVSEIARSLSFSDSHNFCRTYKKLTGLTPSEYRNAYSKRLLFDR